MRARTRGALVAAGLWSVAVLVGAVTLPAYSGSSSLAGADGATSSASTSATLVEANGWGVLVVLTLPLVATLLVAGLVAVRGRVGTGSGAGPWLLGGAWTAVGACLALAALGLLSIGLFVLPVALALAFAVATSAPPVPTRTAAP